jgi:hypothetical protein
MALSPQLQQFKSSGVYRLEFDKSQTVNIPSEVIRLVVGHSRKGPYNTPVLVEDTEQFTQVFGSIDKSLERKGMFFHRSALEALSRGPILAMNLTAKDAQDKIYGTSLVTDGGRQGLEATTFEDEFSKAFDTGKFWTPDDEEILKIAGNTAENSTNALTFVNIKQDPITVIARQASNTDGFNITAREWYGEGNVPEGVDPLEFISEYMVDVFVFKGKFDATELNNDPTFGSIFTSQGVRKDQLSRFTALGEVELLAQYTGSLIPEFLDKEGRQLYIETQINSEARRTGLFCAVNEDAIGAIDMVGKNFDIHQDYELLSHIVEQEDVDTPLVLSAGGTDGRIVEITPEGDMKIYGILPNELNQLGIKVGEWLYSEVKGEYVQIDSISSVGPDSLFTIAGDKAPSKSVYESFSHVANPASFNTANLNINNDGELEITAGGVSASWTPNDVQVGTYLPSANLGEFVEIADIDTTDPNKIVISPSGNVGFSASVFSGQTATGLASYERSETGDTLQNPFMLVSISNNARTVEFPTDWTFLDKGAGIFTMSKIVPAGQSEPAFNPNYSAQDSSSEEMHIKVGMYLPTNADQGELAKIKEIRKQTPVVDGNGDTTYAFEFVCHRNMPVEPEYALKSYDEATEVYKLFPIEGAKKTDKTIAQLLSILKPGTGLSNTLADKDAIDFRYIVDTFGSLEAGGILNKEEIAQLCKERQNATAILNAPMVKELKASQNPSFINEITGEFETRYVETGGNINLNPTSLYTLPSINEGASYVFYYGPGLNVLENGRTKVIPPAAYVSNNYIDKYSDALPWSIIAGPRRGIVGGTGVQGVEFSFDKKDRDVLEPFGYNPIVFERGVGIVIKGNKTAQQSVQSALSSAHVREAMIFIEDGLAAILQDFLFEFNTPQTRLEIQTLADNFMESVKKDNGVFDYRNVMDTTNNTTEVIDNNMGILDTFVEPVKGLEILVSRVTILNTGEIATGNFA